jgi:hypothetical protein
MISSNYYRYDTRIYFLFSNPLQILVEVAPLHQIMNSIIKYIGTYMHKYVIESVILETS